MTWYIKVVSGVPEGSPQEGALLMHSIPGLDLSDPTCGYEPIDRESQTKPMEPNFLGVFEVEAPAGIEKINGMWTLVRKKRVMTPEEQAQHELRITTTFTEIAAIDREFAVSKVETETDPILKAAWQQRITDLDNFVVDVTDPKLPSLPEVLRPPKPTP